MEKGDGIQLKAELEVLKKFPCGKCKGGKCTHTVRVLKADKETGEKHKKHAYVVRVD